MTTDLSRLSNVQKDWDEASADTSNKANWPPDGNYQAVVQRFDFFEHRDQLFLVTEMRVENSGEYDGREVEAIHNLEDPDRIQWVKKHLKTLGLDVETLELANLDSELTQLLDVPVAIRIKTSEQKDDVGNAYRNVYVNDRLGPPLSKTPESDVPSEHEATPEPAASGASKRDKDIPFAFPVVPTYTDLKGEENR